MSASCGIYSIRNVVNGKRLIGSSININRRWGEHKYACCRNIHANDHFQKAWNKYGSNNFEFTILELCSQEMLTLREDAHIAYYNTLDESCGYNMQTANSVVHSESTRLKISNKLKQYCVAHPRCPMLGKKHTEETKRKISAKALGRKVSVETKRKMSLARKGRKHAQESIEKMRIAQRGKNNPAYGKPSWNRGIAMSAETKAKLSLAHKGIALGRKQSEEARRKRSESLRGIKRSAETKAKISASRKGKKHTEETKTAIAEASRRMWNKRREEMLAMKQINPLEALAATP